MLSSLIKACGNALLPRLRPVKPEGCTCLTFTVGGLLFGIDTRIVQEIARYQILAEPRGKPSFIRGLFRHKGIMIPVVDLSARYGHAPVEPGGRTCIVIVELGVGKWRKELGLVVDEVRGLSEFPLSQMKSMPEVVHKMIKVDLVEGLVRLEKDYLVVLDAWRLLSDEEAGEVADFLKLL
jgi:purine-binding chemotaxis protein CheW